LPVRFYTPFQFTFPQQPIKNITTPDAIVHEHWSKHPLATVKRNDVERKIEVSEREEHLLRDVHAQPISPITQRYERLGWNAKTGNAIKDRVIKEGLAR